VVRAPFDGIVSDRKVSAGDTAQVGKELLKVIDPASMRFEGRSRPTRSAWSRWASRCCSASTAIRPVQRQGQARRSVRQRRHPPGGSAGRFAESAQPRVAGLYAEGRIESEVSST
jgi:membrane fusion protein (multidrug efflux system)